MSIRFPVYLCLMALVVPAGARADSGPQPSKTVEELAAAAKGAASPGSLPSADEKKPEAASASTSAAAPAVVYKSDTTQYPFGESQPAVVCAPLRACDIELQAGETVHGVALGDTERWVTSPLFSGDPQNLTPHVIVKPKEYGISTNLIITTTRRTYHIALLSPSESQISSGNNAYARSVSFYYPDDMVREWSNAAELAKRSEERRKASIEAPLSSASLADLHFDGYTLKVKGRAPWTPSLVFDDGQHTYIHFPKALRSGDAPALLALTEDGKTAVLNYRTSPDGLWYIADGLFPRLRLAVGVGRSQARVDIEHAR